MSRDFADVTSAACDVILLPLRGLALEGFEWSGVPSAGTRCDESFALDFDCRCAARSVGWSTTAAAADGGLWVILLLVDFVVRAAVVVVVGAVDVVVDVVVVVESWLCCALA